MVCRSVKPYGKKGPTNTRKNVERSSSAGAPTNLDRQRRLCLFWIQELKGCFVCDEDHPARQRHNRREISAKIDRLKARHPTELLAVEDLSSMNQMNETGEVEEKNEDFDDQVSEPRQVAKQTNLSLLVRK